VAPAHGNAAAVFSKPPPPVALPPLLPLATLDATAQAAESAAGATHGADGFALSAYPRQREIGTEAAPAGYYNYGILIDAGSTGSRAYLYRWHPRQRTLYSSLSLPSAAPRRPFSRPATLPGWSVKTTPGLSDYAAAPARAVEAVRPLVEYALSVLKELGVEDKVPETPVYLKVRPCTIRRSLSTRSSFARLRPCLSLSLILFSRPRAACAAFLRLQRTP
jgi:hypothetical protein